MHRKMNVIAKISCYFERSVVTLELRKEYLNIVIHNISVLLWIKKLNSVIYRTLFYVNIYESYKLIKSPVFWPNLYPTRSMNTSPPSIPDIFFWQTPY